MIDGQNRTAEAAAAPPRPLIAQGYRPDIQGLRAIAVLSVLIYHANEDWLGGGFVGVDIFFVISGYLITGILAREIEKGDASIANFYRRRMRRLFPALFPMLAACLLAGWLLLPPEALRELGRTIVSTTLFVSNIDFLNLTDYFGGEAAQKPLLHTWSLAVEEQFYIVFPILLMLLWRLGRRSMLWTLGALAVASLVASIWLATHMPSAAFYLAPPRAFELLIGSLLALNLVGDVRSERLRDWLSIAGLVLIVLSIALINEKMPFPGLPALAPCLGAALMLHAGKTAPTRAGRWISAPFFLFFGAISYSLYLWHWPLLVYARELAFGRPPLALTLGAVGLAVGLAYASYRFIEQPFLKAKAAKRYVIGAGIAAMAVGVAAGLAFYLGDGAPQRFPPRALAMFAGAEDYNHRRDACHQGDERAIPYDRNCLFGAEGAQPSVAVWGDSYGAELVVALGERLAARGEAAMEITATVCPPALLYDPPARPLCRRRNIETLAHLTSDARIREVVLVANLSGYNKEARPVIAAGYRQVVTRLVAAGKSVVLIAPIPIMPNDPPSALGGWVARRRDPNAYGSPRSEQDARNAWANEMLRDIAGSTPVTLINPADLLCNDLCRAVSADGDRSLYYNRTHISLTGARVVATAIPLSGQIVSP